MTKFLSFAGRLELIRSVIQDAECFWLKVFPLPATVIEKIHRLCRVFLWNSKRALVAWEEIPILKKRVDSISDTFNSGMLPSLLETYKATLDYGKDWLHATDLLSYKRKHHARCASTPKNRQNIFSLSAPLVILSGHISDNGLTLADVCPPSSM
ncbi:UNVERIFIED_CONTAM: hypothetical protein Slati_2229600 [Sesamum latifolium]|uniref:Uncharacterized protein n=1 Tax=Sesamum latifolium TaxID=2727402 RepID=A0AAW2WSP8_9LAMI